MCQTFDVTGILGGEEGTKQPLHVARGAIAQDGLHVAPPVEPGAVQGRQGSMTWLHVHALLVCFGSLLWNDATERQAESREKKRQVREEQVN